MFSQHNAGKALLSSALSRCMAEWEELGCRLWEAPPTPRSATVKNAGGGTPLSAGNIEWRDGPSTRALATPGIIMGVPVPYQMHPHTSEPEGHEGAKRVLCAETF